MPQLRSLLVCAMLFFPLTTHAQYRGMSCEDLFYNRNLIYKNAGYCFKTARAIQIFGNAGCEYDNVRDLPLTSADKDAVRAIVAEESFQRCPR